MKRVPLDKYCEKKIDTLQKNYIGVIDYIDISAVDNEEKRIISYQTIYSKDAPSRAKQLIKKDDILVSTVRPNLNAVAVIENETDNLMVASTGYCVLRCKDDADVRYMFNFCQSPYFIEDMTTQATGASYPAVSTSIVKSSLIPYYSIEEQHEIAKKIDAVSNLIALQKQKLSKLDELVKSRFIELFGDLKSNPHNWQYKNLLDVADIDTVMVCDYEKYADYPHIGIDSIEKNTGRLFGYRTIAEDGVISGKYLFTARHIIYSKIRPNLNKVALPDFDGLCSADAYPILPKENVCLRIYLGYVMRSEFFLDYILPFSRRANMPKVNKEQLSGFNLPVPDIELQRQFAAFVEQTDKSKLAVQKSLDKLETLKKSLMQKFFG